MQVAACGETPNPVFAGAVEGEGREIDQVTETGQYP